MFERAYATQNGILVEQERQVIAQALTIRVVEQRQERDQRQRPLRSLLLPVDEQLAVELSLHDDRRPEERERLGLGRRANDEAVPGVGQRIADRAVAERAARGQQSRERQQQRGEPHCPRSLNVCPNLAARLFSVLRVPCETAAP